MLTESDIWSECLTQLKTALPQQTFETWFQPIVPLGLNNGALTLQVPNQFFYEWIDGHYKNLLLSSLKNIAGEEININYSVLISSDEDNHDRVSARDIPRDIPIFKRQNRHPMLNERYIFPRFVEGANNQFAKAAALAVANNPGQSNFNPLLIYGGVGLGKTHLLQAIGNEIIRKYNKTKLVYVSSDKFTVDFINSIKNNEVHEFREAFASLDVLLIDDIQFFDKKVQTQEQFFHIFNNLYQNGKQIALTVDRQPHELTGLIDRLLSRFKSGLSVDIQAPDLETRIAILTQKAEEDSLDISDDIIEFLATNITSNVRELEGALIRLLAYSSLSHIDIDMEVAKKVLREITGKRKSSSPSIDEIQKLVSDYFNVPENAIIGKRRTREIAIARQVAMYLARESSNYSLKTIGLHFGGRDHSTVVHACNLVEKMVDGDTGFKQQLNDLQRKMDIATY